MHGHSNAGDRNAIGEHHEGVNHSGGGDRESDGDLGLDALCLETGVQRPVFPMGPKHESGKAHRSRGSEVHDQKHVKVGEERTVEHHAEGEKEGQERDPDTGESEQVRSFLGFVGPYVIARRRV